MKAVIPAAGLGTRFLPFTKNAPKEMLPLVDKPAIQYVVEEAVQSGCDDIVIVTGRGKHLIEDHFDISPELERVLRDQGRHEEVEAIRQISDLADIQYVRQKEPRGLGHAIYQARRHIGNEPFAVLLGDDIVLSEAPCTKQLIEQHERSHGAIVAVETIAPEKSRAYGVVDPLPPRRTLGPVTRASRPAPLTGHARAESWTDIRNDIRNDDDAETGGVMQEDPRHEAQADWGEGRKDKRDRASKGHASNGRIPAHTQPVARHIVQDERLLPLRDLVEKPRPEDAPSDLGILGRYVLPASVFDAIRRTNPGRGGEIQLTDALRKLCFHPGVYAYRFEGRRFDLGNKIDWLATNIEVAMQDPAYRERLMPLLRRLAQGPPIEVQK